MDYRTENYEQIKEQKRLLEELEAQLSVRWERLDEMWKKLDARQTWLENFEGQIQDQYDRLAELEQRMEAGEDDPEEERALLAEENARLETALERMAPAAGGKRKRPARHKPLRKKKESERTAATAAVASASEKTAGRKFLQRLPVILALLVFVGGLGTIGLHVIEEEKNAAERSVTEEVSAVGETLPEFQPTHSFSTRPSKLIQQTDIQVNDEIVESYQSDRPIDFGYGQDYTDVEGIVTFRGNNFRESSSYGIADIQKQQFGDFWEVQTGALKAPDGEVWTGSGWVGQPLMMTWPKEVLQNMNMYPWAKRENKLTEVIYATMDGNVYFLELQTGEPTRPPMNLGYTFKGAGALDPRGYPIMYLGSGYDSTKGKSRVFIINLLDCTVMYTFGNGDSFSKRGNLSFFDGSALVDAETDKLIYPGENGILYIMTLNTFYDPDNGVLDISPSPPAKWRYYGKRSASMYLGMEDSAIIWRGHIFFTTNDGYLFCVDLNTLETVWVQDVLDDTNCTSTLELEDGHPYLYVSTSFHLGWRSNTTAEVPVWKIDAENGEIVWKQSYECRSTKGNSGGVQGSIALGKQGLSDLIFVPVARTPSVGAGFLVALNKETGEEVWKLHSPNYSWSSPVAVYDEAGKGYICFCNSAGRMDLIDGLTGEVLDTMNLGSNVEASPAVFENKLVVGTRGQRIFGVTLE